MRTAKPGWLTIAAIMTVIVMVILLPASCGTRSRKPDIIVVLLDACRSDHLSCYGYERKTSPFLDSLAAKGTRFAECRAVAPWTAPSVASIFTGLPPHSHGVLRGVAQERGIHGQELLDDSFVTLAETMKAAGYATFGVSGNAHVSKETGMAQGFDYFTNMWFPQSSVLHEEIKPLKRKLQSARPFFLFVHYFNPHSPYVAAEPWTGQYARHPEMIRQWSGRQMEELRPQIPVMSTNRAILETLVDLYDSDINMVDDYVRRLFAEILPERKAVVVILSDHGEGFLEHGYLGHAQSLFDEELRVPLIIVPPDGNAGGRVVSEPVSLLDIYPTLAEFAGVKAPAGIRGQSLVGAVSGKSVPGPQQVMAEFDRGAALRCIVDNRWKLIADGTNVSARMLFNIASDPGETNNMAAAEPARADNLSLELEALRNATPTFQAPRGAIRLSPEQERMMHALGYVR